MDSTDRKKNDEDPLSPPVEPTVIVSGLNQQVEEALSKAKKLFTDEDFSQATSLVDTLLKTDPHLEGAQELRNQIQLKAEERARELFEQGLNSYMEYDWDRATTLWRKSLQIVADDPASLEWIAKAARRKEHEKVIRSDLLTELEECGKLLSERNYVVAEERLDLLKNRFTGGYRLADLQRIYEALVVRTRVELEKEFEDLRSNMVEPAHPKTVEKPHPARTDPNSKEAQLQRQYMAAFEAGKKHFESGKWDKAVEMWQTARGINPQDTNLKHWIGLAENYLIQGTPQSKQSPVRATIAFLSVFVVTALVTYLGYQKYSEYIQETKNRVLIQRALDHYRAGRLEDSWRTLQIYILHDPNDESARTLLERITAELNARQKSEEKYRELDLNLQNARKQRKSGNYAAALHWYQQVLEIDPAHTEARQEYDQLNLIVDSHQTEARISALLQEAAPLVAEKQFDAATEKLNQVLRTNPDNTAARSLLNAIEAERSNLNRIAVQLEVARYLFERNQKESAALVLNRVLSANPGQPQAKQLLAKVRGASSGPTAVLEIRIYPPARLYIDGRDVGTTSYFNEKMAVGTHILHIELQGYRSVDQGILVKNSERNAFQFQLKAM
ncbi:PEGA domain-containing protein [bacterium]|nr:PEGA domain-containing protein [bacterium]